MARVKERLRERKERQHEVKCFIYSSSQYRQPSPPSFPCVWSTVRGLCVNSSGTRASLPPHCCADSWMDRGVSPFLSILPVSPSSPTTGKKESKRCGCHGWSCCYPKLHLHFGCCYFRTESWSHMLSFLYVFFQNFPSLSPLVSFLCFISIY